MSTAPRMPAGGKAKIYIDHIYTTSTNGYTACVVGQSGVLDSSKGFTAGTSDDDI